VSAQDILRRWLIPNDWPVVVSYSGGNASAYGIRCMIRGILPRPRRLLVLFADTGSEKAETYKHVDAMEALCATHGIEFRRCSAWGRPPRPLEEWAHMPLDATRAKLHEVLMALPAMPKGSRIDQPPIFIAKAGGYGGQVASRCTRHWKIRPMARAVKKWNARHIPRIGCQRIGVGHAVNAAPPVTRWIGYTTDEAHRAPKTAKYKQAFEGALRFPAIALGRSRADVHRDTLAWTGALAPFSACVC
jgi:hypothetical protein